MKEYKPSELTAYFSDQLKGSLAPGTLRNYIVFINRLPYKTKNDFKTALEDSDNTLNELNMFMNRQTKKIQVNCRASIRDLLILYNRGDLAFRLTRYKKTGRVHLKKYLDFHEIKKCVNATMRIEDKLMIMLQYDAGCRISAVLNIKYEDIDFKYKIISLYEKKTGSRPKPTLSDQTMKLLLKYLKITNIKQGKLFKITYSSVNKRQKKIFEKAELPSVTSHWFRGSRAVHLFKDYDVETVCRICGFSPATALLYLKESGIEGKKVMEEHPPEW